MQTALFPAATDRRAASELMFRVRAHEDPSTLDILQPHFDATLERISQCERVILSQETCKLDLTNPHMRRRKGRKYVEPVDPDCISKAFADLMFAVSPTGLPLGTVWHRFQPCEEIEKKKPADQQQETSRWAEGLRNARDVATACPKTSCVYVADCDTNICDLFSETRSNGTDGSASEVQIIVQADPEGSAEAGGWLDHLRATPCLLTFSLSFSRKSEKSKVAGHKRAYTGTAPPANVELRAMTVTVPPPASRKATQPPVTVNVVLVEEPGPPESIAPIQWILATTLPISTLEEIRMIVDTWSHRWQISTLISTLREGLTTPHGGFDEPYSLEELAASLIISWRVNYLLCLFDDWPDCSCELVFQPSEWKCLCAYIHRGEPVPAQPLRLKEMIELVAQSGGYIKRSRSVPGVRSLWQGLQGLQTLAFARPIFGSGD